jgi:ketosteroid isomerase-like protein
MVAVRTVFTIVACVGGAGLFASCSSPSQQSGNQQAGTPSATTTDHRAADEATIRGLDSAWVKTVAAKDTARALSYYASNASLMVPDAPIATGTDAIHKAFSGMMSLPGFALSFAPDKVSVIGDAAYEIGDYHLTVNNKAGKPETHTAKYIVVWGRQPDSSWKVLVDAATTAR